jgi:WD40 repeat protein
MIGLAGCRPALPVPIVVEVASTPGWQIYNNQKHDFSLQYPPGWQVKEVPSSDPAREHDEVWFSSGEFPPANTGARPDVLFIVTKQDPSARWAPDYFDHYQSEIVQVDNGRATRVSGVNKESLSEEIVYIMELNGVYLQALPGISAGAAEFFGRILTSLEPAPEAVSIPNSSDVPDTFETGDPCIFPYSDPVAFLPHQDRILVRADAGVKVFNLKTLEEELALKPARRQIVEAALSPDGHVLAWALDDHSVDLIDLESGVVLKKLQGHIGMVTAIKFSTTGERIYTASHDHSVRVWNDDGSLLSEIFPGGGEVLGIGVSPDDRRLTIITFEAPQKLWDLRANRLIRYIRTSGAFDGADAGFSPDGNLLTVSLGGGPASIWDARTGRQVWSGGEYALALSPDGRFFAYSDIDENGNGVVVTRSLAGLEPIHVLQGGGSLIWKIIVSPDGSRLASADGNEIRVWQVSDGALLYTLRSACP